MKKILIFLPLIILLCLASSCKQGEETADKTAAVPAEADTGITVDSIVSEDGVSIVYETRGEGEPALIFLHGWSNNRSIWDATAAHFGEKYKVVTIDIAGFGESGNNREIWTMESFAEDVAAIVKKLNLKKAVIMGFSMGAPVALEAALLIPEHTAGVVLVDDLQDITKVYSQEEIDGMAAFMTDLITDPTMEKLTGFFNQNKEEAFEKVKEMLAGAPRPGWMDSLHDYFRWNNEKMLETLEKIQAPVMAINSDKPPTNVEAFKKYVPTFEAKIIPGAGHVVFWDAPDEFNRFLEEAIQTFYQTEK